MAEAQLSKNCTVCNEAKPLVCFGRHKASPDGMRAQCKDCVKIYNAAQRARQRQDGTYDRHMKAKAKYRRENGTGRTERVKRWHENGELFCSIMKARRWSPVYEKPKTDTEIDLKKVAAGDLLLCQVRGVPKPPKFGSAEWQSYAPPAMVKSYLDEKPWRKAGLPQREYQRIRYALDPEFHARCRTRNRLRSKVDKRQYAALMRAAIKRGGNSPSVQAALGYSAKDLLDHIVSQFSSDMTLEAFLSGAIHIDHIRPCCTFDMNDPKQIVECWSLDNLRPLWAKDNMRRPRTSRVL